MSLKFIPGGQTLAYVEGPVDSRGDLRDATPLLLRGDRPSAERLLGAQEPGWVRDLDTATSSPGSLHLVWWAFSWIPACPRRCEKVRVPAGGTRKSG